jgi:hypothetical protein
MTQSDAEKLLTGMWQNLKSHYLWSFYPLSDGQRNGIVVDNNRPVGGTTFWYEVSVTDNDTIFINFVIGGKGRQCKIVLLSENIIQLFEPPFDNDQQTPDGSIILNKVSL